MFVLFTIVEQWFAMVAVPPSSSPSPSAYSVWIVDKGVKDCVGHTQTDDGCVPVFGRELTGNDRGRQLAAIVDDLQSVATLRGSQRAARRRKDRFDYHFSLEPHANGHRLMQCMLKDT